MSMLEEKATVTVNGDNGSLKKALYLWEHVSSHPAFLFLKGKVLTENMNRAAYYLEKAGKLNIVMYDFSDKNRVFTMRFENCTIDDSTGLICYNDSYVCRLDELYYLASNSIRIFIIDFLNDNDKNVELIAKMTWKWLDNTLGSYICINRTFNWNEPPRNFVPSYVVHTARLFVEKGRNNVDTEFHSNLVAAWKLVNHRLSKELLKDKYPNVKLLDA